MSSPIVAVDRYSVFGPPNGCRGPCEGTGWVPVRPDGPGWDGKDDTSVSLREAWREAEAKESSDDGYHFVRCPECNAAGGRK